jgi:hypothetical protein
MPENFGPQIVTGIKLKMSLRMDKDFPNFTR